MNKDQKLRRLKLLHQKAKLKAEGSFFDFFKQAWKVQEPETDLQLNWHIKYLCDLFQAEVERVARKQEKIQDIIVNISPRSTKSKIVSINLAPWAWIKYPWLKFMNSSHSMELSTELCVKSRWLIESEWYQRNWGRSFKMASDQNVKTYYVNNKGGARIATSVGKKVSGKGADIIIADDLIDPEDSESELSRTDAVNHYRSGLYTRLNDKKVGVRFLIMQRVHEEDPAGIELKERRDKYKLICVPAEESEQIEPPELKQYYKDGLFDVNRFDKKILQESRIILGGYKYASQFMQNPSTPGGEIFKKDWWKFYDQLPKIIDRWIQSWDLTFDEGDDKAYVVGQVCAKKDHNAYLVYEFRQQVGFNDQIRAFRSVSQMFPKTYKKLVEKKANGAALIDVLKSEIIGITPVEPNGSKEARAISVSPIVEAGCVYLPNIDTNPWVIDFMNECAKFPKGTYADRVDTMSQALNEFFGSAENRLRKLLEEK